MNTQKMSISVSQQQCEFIETYKEGHHYKSRSSVIRDAINLLQQAYLEKCYLAAEQEVSELTHDFDNVTADGLDNDEAW